MTKPNELDLIKQHIKRASDMLRQSTDDASSRDDLGSLIYMGNHHDSVPRDLVMDPLLDSGEVHTWMLMKIHINNPHLPSSIPSQNDLMGLLKCSRPVVSRHMQVLRALRWITLCDEVRSDDGRIRGHVYAQHDAPLSIQDTLVLDQNYIDFLEKPCTGDVLKRLRMIKEAALRQIHHDLKDGLDLNQLPTQMQKLAQGLGGIDRKTDYVKDFYMVNRHVKKINMVENHVKDFYVDENDVSSGSSNNIYNKNNIYIKTTTTSTTKPQDLIKNLRFPSFFRDSDHLKTLASELLNRIEPEKQQFALDYLADRVRAGEQGTDKPVGNSIAYLNWVVRELANGTLPPSAYGVRKAPTPAGPAASDGETPEQSKQRWIEDMRRKGFNVDPGTGALEKIKHG